MTEVEEVPPGDINIMSQYNAQCSTLRDSLTEAGFNNYTVSTVVASQGNKTPIVTQTHPQYKWYLNDTL